MRHTIGGLLATRPIVANVDQELRRGGHVAAVARAGKSLSYACGPPIVLVYRKGEPASPGSPSTDVNSTNDRHRPLDPMLLPGTVSIHKSVKHNQRRLRSATRFSAALLSFSLRLSRRAGARPANLRAQLEV
jgi:hypothetical protein